ncbi:MAG: TetR/AcrR family transcriptional regulator [Chloroflexi bacterium]|nr:TetR/AcrR family transcriptional regulator [Chloroflexota bacterium]
MNQPVKPRSTRRPRGSLSRQQVVEAALQLADQDGLEALSMLTLARRLDCGVMTIYGYVDNKEDLLDAIALRGLADVRLPRPLPAEPRAVLMAWGRALRLTLLQHPSLPMVFLSQAVIGPGIFQGIEALLGALGRAGVSATFGVHAIYAVVIYGAGFVAWELPRTRRQPESEYAAAWRREFASLSQERFPITASVLDELPRLAGEQQFEFGLAALVDGLVNAPHQSA